MHLSWARNGVAHRIFVVAKLNALYIPASRTGKVHINAIKDKVTVAVKSGACPITTHRTMVSDAPMGRVEGLTTWHRAGVIIFAPVRSDASRRVGY